MEVNKIVVNGNVHVHIVAPEPYEGMSTYTCCPEEPEEDIEEIEEDEEDAARLVGTFGDVVDFLTEHFYMDNPESSKKDKGRFAYRLDDPDRTVRFGQVSGIYTLYYDDKDDRRLFIPTGIDFQFGWEMRTEE